MWPIAVRYGSRRLSATFSVITPSACGEDRWPIRQCFWRKVALGVFRFLDHSQVHVLQGKQDPPLGGFDLRPTSYVLRPVDDRDRAGGGGRRGRQPAAA